MGDLLVITGAPGAGKLRVAANLVSARGGPVVYLAAAHWSDPAETARQAWEKELGWRDVEEPLDAAGVIRREGAGGGCIVVDRLSLYTANWMEHADDPDMRLEDLLAACREVPADVILITNEVGWDGAPPPTSYTRLHRDVLSQCNQRAAAAANQVYLTVAGLPLRLKPWTAAGRE